MNDHPDPTEFLTTEQAAPIACLSPRTLESYRRVGGGPPYYKIGRWVRYTRENIENWLRKRIKRSTSDDGSNGETSTE